MASLRFFKCVKVFRQFIQRVTRSRSTFEIYSNEILAFDDPRDYGEYRLISRSEADLYTISRKILLTGPRRIGARAALNAGTDQSIIVSSVN